MTSFMDFERVNNTLLAALGKPEFAEIVNLAIKYKVMEFYSANYYTAVINAQ